MIKYVKAESVDDYFSLPKKEREKYGIYISPLTLPWTGSADSGWDEWSRLIRKEYPVQGFIREWLFSYDNPVYAFISRTEDKLRDFKYSVKHLLKPACPRFRKAYPRHQWKDITQAVVDVNFALILDFYYEEVMDGHVDWESTPCHKEFMKGLIYAVEWIEEGLPRLDEDLRVEYERVNPDLPYADAYQKVVEIEKEIETKITEILKFFIDNRGFFWT